MQYLDTIIEVLGATAAYGLVGLGVIFLIGLMRAAIKQGDLKALGFASLIVAIIAITARYVYDHAEPGFIELLIRGLGWVAFLILAMSLTYDLVAGVKNAIVETMIKQNEDHDPR